MRPGGPPKLRGKENAHISVVLSGAEAVALVKALATVNETKTIAKIADKVQGVIDASETPAE